MHDFHIEDTLPRRLSRFTQSLIVIGLFVVGSAWWLGQAMWNTHAAIQAAHANRIEPNAKFQLTTEQLATLKIVPTQLVRFRDERVADGKIASNGDRTTPVFSPFTGRVIKVLANPGDSVKQGTPLLTVEANEFVQGQNDLLSAASTLRTTRAQLRQAEITEQRKHALLEAQAGSQQDWQQSQSDLVAAQNAVRSAEAAVALVRNRLRILGKTDTEIRQLETAGTINATATITAPIAGTVTDRQVGVGQYIQAGASNPVFAIADLSAVWLVANIREADIGLVRKDDTVEVRVLAFPDRIFRARITHIAPLVDPNSHRISVRAEIENADNALKPEMFASFSIISGNAANAPGVPDAALIYEGDAAHVWVLNPGNNLEMRNVRTGRSANGVVEVTAGLKPGDKVVMGGSLFIDRAARED